MLGKLIVAERTAPYHAHFSHLCDRANVPRAISAQAAASCASVTQRGT